MKMTLRKGVYLEALIQNYLQKIKRIFKFRRYNLDCKGICKFWQWKKRFAKYDTGQIKRSKNNELAQKDLNDLVKKKEKYESELKIFLLPKDDDDKNAIVEIRAGTGGWPPFRLIY